LAIYPGNADAWFNLATTYAEFERYDDAQHAFQQSIRYNPSFAKPYTNLLIMSQRRGDQQEARKVSQEIIKRFGKGDRPRETVGNVEQFMALGHAYNELKMYQKAIWAFRGAIQGDPTDADARMSLGRAYMETKDFADAEAEFKKVTELSPMTQLGWAQLGRALAGENKLIQAHDSLVRACQMDPGDSETAQLLQQVEQLLRRR
jgi:Flp pilus assembly protein TadD